MRARDARNAKWSGRPPPILWLARHTPYRLSAIAFLGFILGAKTFALGCGPAAGERGGKCKDDGCHTYCENDSVCDNSTSTCVASVPSVGFVPPPPECHTVSNRACPAEVAWSCSAGAVPKRTCTLASEDDAGGSIHCCAPQCEVGTARAGEDCAGGSWAYCDDPLSPEGIDAGLLCITVSATSWDTHSYCCAPTDTCFAMPSGDAILPCEATSQPYFCSGDASPSPASLRCAAAQNDAGSALHGYCCEEVDGGSDGDAGDGSRD